jgi:hypothetical protein
VEIISKWSVQRSAVRSIARLDLFVAFVHEIAECNMDFWRIVGVASEQMEALLQADLLPKNVLALDA